MAGGSGRVYVANFGFKNVHWPICISEKVITLQLSDEVRTFWLANDPKGWQQWAASHERMANGKPALPQVSSRWFNLLTLFRDTTGDHWLHRAEDKLFWATTLSDDYTETSINDPFGGSRKHWLWRKRVDGWSDKSRAGSRLNWATVHPKARDFLQTEATYQEVSSSRGYKDYALSLIYGQSLDAWQSMPEWVARKGGKDPGRSLSSLEITIYNAIQRMKGVVAAADGRIVQRVAKLKEMKVSEIEMNNFLLKQYDDQQGLCALTGLQMLLHDEDGARDMQFSVDRIDSRGHYEPSNIQLVCQFVNFWKGASQDNRFRELMRLVREPSRI